jgi:hypothetical protein
MSAVTDLTEDKQFYKMPNGEFQIETPELFFFVVKMNGRKFLNQEHYEIDASRGLLNWI